MTREFIVGDKVIHPDTGEPSTITDIVPMADDADDPLYNAVFYELDEGDILFGPELLELLVTH